MNPTMSSPSSPLSSDFCVKGTQASETERCCNICDSCQKFENMFKFKSPSLCYVVLPWGVCIGAHSHLWSNLENECSLLSKYPCKGSWILQAITFINKIFASQNCVPSRPYARVSFCSQKSFLSAHTCSGRLKHFLTGECINPGTAGPFQWAHPLFAGAWLDQERGVDAQRQPGQRQLPLGGWAAPAGARAVSAGNRGNTNNFSLFLPLRWTAHKRLSHGHQSLLSWRKGRSRGFRESTYH